MLNSITLGADPEYIFKNKGRLVPANDIFGERMIHGRIGTDGHPATAEIRPRPRKDAIALFDEVKDCLREVYTNYNKEGKFSGHAGSVGGEGAHKAMAGHIHFGIKNKADIEKFVDYCDVPSLMLLFIEDYNENVLRRKHRDMDRRFYGDLGSYRIKKPYGFEYRVPSSWLVSPAITKGYFCLYHALAHDFIKGKFNSKHPLTKMANFIGEYELSKQFRESQHDAFIFKLKTIQRGLKELTMYKKNYKNYKAYINTLFSLVKTGKRWNENQDIFETWGFKSGIGLEKNFFHFQTKDFKISDIKITNAKIENNGSRFPIRVFGLNDKRDFNISTNNENIMNAIVRFKREHGDMVLVPEISAIYGSQRTELGIGRGLRDNNQELVKELLKFIKTNRKTIVQK